MLTARPSPRDAGLAPPSDARVGISTALPGSQFEARRIKLNGQVVAQQDLNDQTIAKRKAGGMTSGEWSDYVAWQSDWASFVSRWGKFQTDSTMNWVFGPDESSLQDLEQTCYALRLRYDALDGVVRSSGPIDTPYKPPPSPYDWAKAIGSIVAWGAVGVGLFYGGKIAWAYVQDRRRQRSEVVAGALGGVAEGDPGELEVEPEGLVRTP